MISRKRLRTWLGIKEKAGPNTPTVNDDEILNVLRREKEKENGEDELTTKEITDELPIVRKTVSNRLKNLEGERVNKRRAGSTDMWSLAVGEPETVVNPDMGPIVEYSSSIRRKATDIKTIGRQLAEMGFVFLIVGMTIGVSDLALPRYVEIFLASGYLIGLTGAGVIGGSTLLRLIGLVAPQLAERFLLK